MTIRQVLKRISESLKSYCNTLKMVVQEFIGRGLEILMEIFQQLIFICRYAGIGV